MKWEWHNIFYGSFICPVKHNEESQPRLVSPFHYRSQQFLLVVLKCADKLIRTPLQKAIALRSTSTSAIIYMCVVLSGCSCTGVGVAEWARPPIQNLFPLLSCLVMKLSGISGSIDPMFTAKKVLNLQQGHKLTHKSTEHLLVPSHSLSWLWALTLFPGTGSLAQMNAPPRHTPRLAGHTIPGRPSRDKGRLG